MILFSLMKNQTLKLYWPSFVQIKNEIDGEMREEYNVKNLSNSLDPLCVLQAIS